MAAITGADCKIYRNTATYGTPTWAEMVNVKDVTLDLSRGEADVSTRGGNGWKATVATLAEGSVTFQMVWDGTDTDFTAVKDAWFDKTLLDVAIMDGDITTPGSQGLRAEMTVTGFSRSEPLEDAVTVDVTLKPARTSNAPEWMEVGT